MPGEDFFEEFLVQYYSEREPPKELILEHETDPALAEFLSVKKGKQVRYHRPAAGEKRAAARPRKKNLEIAFFRDTLKGARTRNCLNMAQPPSSDRVFRYLAPLRDRHGRFDGAVSGREPDKNKSRRFKIKTVEGIDDFASIAEVVKRRYKRLTDENALFTDLVIINES